MHFSLTILKQRYKNKTVDTLQPACISVTTHIKIELHRLLDDDYIAVSNPLCIQANEIRNLHVVNNI